MVRSSERSGGEREGLDAVPPTEGGWTARALSKGSAVLTSGRGPQGDRERAVPSLVPEYLRPGRLSPGSLTLSHTCVPSLTEESHVFTRNF